MNRQLENNLRASTSDFDANVRQSAWLDSERDVLAQVATPTVYVGLGGAGGNVLRRVKSLLSTTHCNQPPVHFLVVDTDDQTKSPHGHLPGFSDREFLHLNMARARMVLENPDRHPLIAKRLDLLDDRRRNRLLGAMGGGLQQAGQIRPLGLLALLANIDNLRKALESIRAEMNQRWGELAEAGRVHFRKSANIGLVCSTAGGTGASMLLDVGVLISDLFRQDGNSVQQSAYLLLANNLQGPLGGMAESVLRGGANEHSLLKELHALDDGWAGANDVRMAGNQRNAILPASGVFSQVYVVGRKDSSGADMGSLEATFDNVALHLATSAMPEFGEVIEMTNAAEVHGQGQVVDADTGLKRLLGTIAGSAAVIPSERVLRYCATNQIEEFLKSVVLGGDVDGNDSRGEAPPARTSDRAQAGPHKESADAQSLLDGCNLLDERLLACSMPSPDVFIRPLTPPRSSRSRTHFTDTQFKAEAEMRRQHFKDTDLRDICQLMADEQKRISRELNEAFGQHFRRCLESGALRGAQRQLRDLEHRLQRIGQQYKDDADGYSQASARLDQQTLELLKQMRRRLLGSTNKDLQNRIILSVRRTVEAAGSCQAKLAAHRVIGELRADISRRLASLDRQVSAIEPLIQHVHSERLAARPREGVITTTSQAEIDMMPPSAYRDFYATHRLDNGQLLDALAKRLGRSAVEVTSNITSKRVLNELRNHVVEHYRKAVHGMNVAELIGDQLEAGGERARQVRSRVAALVAANRPMWQADPRCVDVHFSDMLLLGVPENTSEKVREQLEAIANEAAAGLNDGPYLGAIHMVSTRDPHRIYVLRRCYGASAHYLRTTRESRQAYEQWRQLAGLPTHIFSQEQVATMPRIDPIKPATRAESAFAIGLAYGWIAKRGPDFYFNLERNGNNGSSSFVASLTSHWDCIPYHSQQLALKEGAVLTTTQASRLTYCDRNAPSSETWLGRGIEVSQRALANSPERVDAVQDAFVTMRTIAGDKAVASELAAYLATIGADLTPRDKIYASVSRIAELLQLQVERLRRGE
ncbi:MAG: hypothetical protein KDB14_02235 [Planctomycetales bacterium]|nr:hypothetical protein [Planctomycetales bacterium]